MSDLLARFDKLGLAILLATMVWGAVTLLGFIIQRPSSPPRYTIVADAQPGIIYRMDNQTGVIWMCISGACRVINWVDANPSH